MTVWQRAQEGLRETCQTPWIDMATIAEDQFGFLPIHESWAIGEFVISPVADHKEIVRAIHDDSEMRSGFYYTRMAHWHTEDPRTGESERRPQSRNVPHLFRMYPTHSLRRRNGEPLGETQVFREQRGFSLITLLAYLHRCRGQFHDWFFDGRVPVKSQRRYGMIPREFEPLASQMWESLLALSSELRERLVAAMYTVSRARSYEWHWERFLFAYIALEAIHKTLQDHGKLAMVHTNRQWEHRYEQWVQSGLLWSDEASKSKFQEMSELRNEIVHEAMMRGGLLVRDNGGGVSYVMLLENILERLLLGALDVCCGHRKTPWNTRGVYALDLHRDLGSGSK